MLIIPETHKAVGILVTLLDRNTATLTTKAPSVIPGAILYPKSKMIAKANPDGGQSGVAFEFWKENSRLNLANTKYPVATASIERKLLKRRYND